MKAAEKSINKAVLDGSVSNICSLIHLVILQSLGDTIFFKEPYRQTDTQTHRAYKGLQVPPFNLTVNVGNDNALIVKVTSKTLEKPNGCTNRRDT